MITTSWENSFWGDLASLEYGKSLRDYKETGGDFPVYGTNGQIGWHSNPLWNYPGIIVGRKGAYRGIHYSGKPFFVIDTAFYLKPKVIFDLRWAYYCLSTYDINSMDSGSAIPSLSRDSFYQLPVLLPPLPEQQKIADILTTVDDHISETESLIEKTKVLKQGMMQQLLTKGIGHTEFKDTEIGRIPVEWEVVPFNSVVYFQEGPGLRNWQYTESGMPFLNIRCLQNGSVDRKNIQYISTEEFENKYSHFALDCGDIVVSSSGTLGKKSIIKETDLPIMLNTSIIRLRSSDAKHLDMGFLNYFVESDYYQKAVKQESVGSAQANYGPYHLNRIKIFLPPLPEQQLIATVLTKVDDQIDIYQSKLDSLTSLKTGLMQQLLTGKIRVKV